MDIKGFLFSLVKPAAPAGSVNLPVQVDINGPNTTVSVSAPLATTSIPGLVKPDGTTVTVTAGVISAAASSTAYAVDSGTANTYAATGTPVLAAGLTIELKIAHSNTGASTFNWNAGGAVAIKKTDGATALVGGELVAGQVSLLVYDGTVWQITGGSSPLTSVFFGQGQATASANNTITLGSAPIAGSVQVFVAGVLISPSTYSISGALITVSSFMNGVVVVQWVTTTSTPGGISLGGGPLRGTSKAFVTTAAVTIALPAAAVAGDFAILFASGQNAIGGGGQPSGWTVLNNPGAFSFYGGSAFSKLLTSGDITAGTVTISSNGTGGLLAAMAVFVGNTSGVRETDVNQGGFSSPATQGTTTSGAVLAAEYMVMFASARASVIPTIDVGVVQQSNTDANLNSGALYFQTRTTSGAFTATATYSGFNPNGFCQTLVIVKP